MKIKEKGKLSNDVKYNVCLGIYSNFTTSELKREKVRLQEYLNDPSFDRERLQLSIDAITETLRNRMERR